MLYLMMTDQLPFEADNDLESLLRVQKAEFTPPEDAKPAIGAAVAAIIMRAMRLHPAERYQTADEMLVDVERVLRTEFQSAGQTELKRGSSSSAAATTRRRSARRRATRAASSSDIVGTDLSVGTSFELRDLEQSTEQTELQRGRTPSPEPRADRRGEASRSRRRCRAAGTPPRSRSRAHAPTRGARAGSGWASSSRSARWSGPATCWSGRSTGA